MQHFFSLTPDRLLDAVERALGRRATGRCFALNSMENRVYDVELEDTAEREAESVIAKFYRPGRWSREAILDEHRFLGELIEAEVPAVAPLLLASGSTLDALPDGILFAIFPKVRGRNLPELADGQLAQIGRLLGRLHNVGAARPAPHRLTLTVESHALEPLAALEAGPHLDAAFASRYRHYVERIAAAARPLLERAARHRTHGDCHLANVLWQNDGPFFLDFDDMLVAPSVQDVWLIVRGRSEEADRQREVLLSGYEQMREFDRSSLRLVEPLRALRMIHYAGWIARRYEDPSFQRAFPDFGSTKWWAEEVQTLDEQLSILEGAPAWPPPN